MTRGVDGLFLVVGDEVADDRGAVDELSNLSVPFVMVDRVVDELVCDKVMFDHELGGYMATRYLLQMGHRRIACMVNAKKNHNGTQTLGRVSSRIARVGHSGRSIARVGKRVLHRKRVRGGAGRAGKRTRDLVCELG